MNRFGQLNRKKALDFLFDHVVEVILIILILAMGNISSTFNTTANWLNIFRNMSMKGLIAFGMTMVIISGQIDLSIGSTVALSGVIVARACRDLPEIMGISVSLACVLGMLMAFMIAILMGVIHGYAQHKFRMPAFIVTLASQNLLYGLAGILSNGFPIANTFPDWFSRIGVGKISGTNGLPIPALILFIFFLIMLFVLKFTTTGRSMYAIGGNVEAARLSGLPVKKILVTVYALSGLFAGLAGLVMAGRLSSAQPQAGVGYELDAIAAVVIGGASLAGGTGKATGTLIGAILLAVIRNGLNLLNVSSFWQQIVIGLVIALAVGFDVLRKKTTT